MSYSGSWRNKWDSNIIFLCLNDAFQNKIPFTQQTSSRMEAHHSFCYSRNYVGGSVYYFFVVGSSRCHWYALGSILSLNLSPVRWGISLLNKAISEDPKDSRDHRQAWEEQLAWCVEFQNTLSISDRSLIQTCHTEQQNLSIRVCLPFGRNFPESSTFNWPQSVTRGKCCFPSGIEFHTNWNFFFSNWYDLKGLVNELERKKKNLFTIRWNVKLMINFTKGYFVSRIFFF